MKKGFTLIELLAVIVILAIIALIATPTILGVIETARKGAAESSALGYIDAVEKQIAIDMVAGTNVVDYANGTIDVDLIEGLNLKGEEPTSGTITVNNTTGIIDAACLVVTLNSKDYNVSYDGSEAEVVDECPTANTDNTQQGGDATPTDGEDNTQTEQPA